MRRFALLIGHNLGEPGEDLAALGHLGLVGDRGDQEAPADVEGGRVVLGEEDRPVVPVVVEELLDGVHLGRRREGELPMLPVGGEGPAPLQYFIAAIGF